MEDEPLWKMEEENVRTAGFSMLVSCTHVGKLLIKVEVHQIASELIAKWETPSISRVSPSLTLSGVF